MGSTVIPKLMPNMLDFTQKSLICNQYRQGKSIKNISKQMGYSPELVQRVLKLYGLLNRTRARLRQAKLDEFMEEVNTINGTKYKVEGSQNYEK